MWRSLLAMLLVPPVAFAQMTSETFTTIYQTSPKAVSYKLFDRLRQGTEEKVAIIIENTVYVSSPRVPVGGMNPISLTLQPEEGLEIISISYPKPFKHKFQFQSERVPVFRFPNQQVEVRMRATPNAALGMHVLSGRLVFQPVSDEGKSAPQSIDVEIPIVVVDHGTKVVKNLQFPWQDRIPEWGDMPLGLKILVVPLFPVLVIGAALACSAGGEDCRC